MPARFYPEAPLPAYLERWERLDSENNLEHLVDEPWRHFEPYLASRGYSLCWRYYSRDRPETPVRHASLSYPVAKNPFQPRSREGFVHLADIDGDAIAGNPRKSCDIHQTTGWLTQVRRVSGPPQLSSEHQNRLYS
jgi:hypothetical protein